MYLCLFPETSRGPACVWGSAVFPGGARGRLCAPWLESLSRGEGGPPWVWVSAGWLRLGEWEQGADRDPPEPSPSVGPSPREPPLPAPAQVPLGALRDAVWTRDGPVGCCVSAAVSPLHPHQGPPPGRPPIREYCGRGPWPWTQIAVPLSGSIGVAPGLAGVAWVWFPRERFCTWLGPGSCFSNGSLWENPVVCRGSPKPQG